MHVHWKHISLALAAATLSASAASQSWIGRFDASVQGLPPAPWRVVRIDEKVPATEFALRRWDGVNAVEAQARASMAMLARPLDADLNETPVLCWRWRVDAALKNADIKTKNGDDFAARVYVAFTLRPEDIGWATRAKLALGRSIYGDVLPDAALSYVWDNRSAVGSMLPNAYTDRTQMVVLRSGNSDAGGWVTERRDLLADMQSAFRIKAPMLKSIAISSDTDNTGEQARAGFADLHLVARKAACEFGTP